MPQTDELHYDKFLFLDCVERLKVDYNDFGKPVNDDNKSLQRFCVKLEFLLRYDIIGKEFVHPLNFFSHHKQLNMVLSLSEIKADYRKV